MIIADVLLNCSGHKLTKRAQDELLQRFAQIEDVAIPSINFDSDVQLQIQEIVHQIATPLNGSVTIAIIPPGQSTVAILMLAYLNGLVGYFPALCYLSADRPGEYMPHAVFILDPQKVRDQGRRFRQAQWLRVESEKKARDVPTG